MPLTTSDAPSNLSRPNCDVCGSPEGYAGIAAVPGAPVSISWCNECLQRNCLPMFAVEATVCFVDPEHPEHNRDLAESVAFHKANGVGPDLELAEWFLEENTYVDGGYVRIRDLLQRLWDAAPSS